MSSERFCAVTMIVSICELFAVCCARAGAIPVNMLDVNNADQRTGREPLRSTDNVPAMIEPPIPHEHSMSTPSLLVVKPNGATQKGSSVYGGV